MAQCFELEYDVKVVVLQIPLAATHTLRSNLFPASTAVSVLAPILPNPELLKHLIQYSLSKEVLKRTTSAPTFRPRKPNPFSPLSQTLTKNYEDYPPFVFSCESSNLPQSERPYGTIKAISLGYEQLGIDSAPTGNIRRCKAAQDLYFLQHPDHFPAYQGRIT